MEQELPEFEAFPKMPRMSRDIIITEKIDGTNAQILITPNGEIFAGSRTRWITPKNDNFGFAKWVEENRISLLELGEGRHFGEWWGQGIQRGYNMDEKVFSLFNVSRWSKCRPWCCELVPVLYYGEFTTNAVEKTLAELVVSGSLASPGFMDPEGVIVFHVSGRFGLKKTVKNDGKPKSQLTA